MNREGRTDESNFFSDEYPDICVVTHPLSHAGENATRTLLAILSAFTSVSLITADLPTDSTIRSDHEVIEISRQSAGDSMPIATIRFLANQFRMTRIIARRDEQFVLFFGATAYLIPMLLCRAMGRTLIVEPRGDVPLTLRLNWETQVPSSIARVLAEGVRLLERCGFNLADGVITYTPAMASQLGLDGFESKVYPTGARYVDVERFRIATPLPDREPVVGFVGRLDQEKGIRQLAQAARLLSDEYRFRFIGDGALKSWIEREFSEEIGAGKIELTGWVPHDQIPNELNRLRMLVLPSQPTEGLPTTILEAFACGTPVYATPVSGVVDVIEPEETGFLINQTDSEALASAISEILAREDLHRISKNARNLAVREYSYEAAVSRYQSIVRSISASPELR